MSDDQDPKPGGRREMPEEVRAALRDAPVRSILRLIELSGSPGAMTSRDTLRAYDLANRSLVAVLEAEQDKPEK